MMFMAHWNQIRLLKLSLHGSSIGLILNLRGCSGGRPSSMLVSRLSSLLSISVVKAINVSLENPHIFETSL